MRRTTVVVALLVVVGVGLAASGFSPGQATRRRHRSSTSRRLRRSRRSRSSRSTATTDSGRTRAEIPRWRGGRSRSTSSFTPTRRRRGTRLRGGRGPTGRRDRGSGGGGDRRRADQVLALVERDWADAHSSDRYSYMEEEPDRGVWLGETFELHDGAYLGVRDHLRAYESPPDGTYTAVHRPTRSTTTGSDSATRFRASTTRRSGSKTNSFTARSTPRLAASTAAWRAAGAMAGSL